MREQRIVLFAFYYFYLLCFMAVKKGGGNASDDANLVLSKMKYYEVDATVTFLKDTQPNVIKIKQKAQVGGPYTMIIESPERLKGYQVSYENNEVIEYNPITKTSSKGKVLTARNEILLGNFIKHYLEESTSKCEKTTLDNVKAICFETIIPGDYKYMASEKLWFDENKKAPIKMEVIGVDGSTSILIEFESFKYN